MKKVISVFLIITMLLGTVGCGSDNTDAGEKNNEIITYDIENDINTIKNIFACVNVEKLAETYAEEITGYDDLTINGTFAGINGTYDIELYEENEDGFETGNIYAVRFTWDYTQEVPMEEVVKAMCDYLGNYEDNYDEEWSYYCWTGSEQTKFSNAPFANSFDIEIFGDDCYIVFGMYTIS